MNCKTYVITKDDCLFVLTDAVSKRINMFQTLKNIDITKGSYKNPILLQNISKKQFDWVLKYCSLQDKSKINLEYKEVLDILNIKYTMNDI